MVSDPIHRRDAISIDNCVTRRSKILGPSKTEARWFAKRRTGGNFAQVALGFCAKLHTMARPCLGHGGPAEGLRGWLAGAF
jgi:hypothetical protein